VVQVTVGWGGELKSSEADIIEGFVINAHDLVGIFYELMDREGSIVWLNDSVGHLGGWHNGKCAHDSVWVLLSYLGDKKCSHTGAGTSS